RKYDVLVIGTGPGGEGAAMQAVKEGRTVAAVERHSVIGGGCTHWGTIPSKALRYAIFQLTEVKNNPLYRFAIDDLHVSFPDLRKSAGWVIEKQVTMRRGFYDRNGVDLLFGHARFLDPHTVEIAERNGGRQVVSAEAIVVATGSRPYRPEGVNF